MRRMDRELISINQDHRRESYIGNISSTKSGGKSGNVNHMKGSQIRESNMMSPYGISSRPSSGIKAQTIVDNHSNSSIVGVYDPKRPSVEVGGIKIYSSGGASIHVKASGDIEIKNKSGNIVDISADGISIEVGGTTMNISDTSVLIDKGGTLLLVNDSTISATRADSRLVINNSNAAISRGSNTVRVNDSDILVDTGSSSVTVSPSTVNMKMGSSEVIADASGVTCKNGGTSVVVDSGGSCQINASSSINLSSSGNIEFTCAEFKVNSQTMVIP